MFAPPSRAEDDPDAPIRQTDSDAALARLSAVQKGYLRDPFVRFFVPRAHLQPPRPPLINVGTFVRTTAIDTLVNRWLWLSKEHGTQCQIVSVGAGSDTRFWRLSTSESQDQIASYVELDFPEITSKKVMSIRKSKELGQVLGSPQDIKVLNGGTTLHAPKYHLIPTDLRLPPNEALKDLLEQGGLSLSLPTLVICECVLAYMEPEASAALIQWFVDHIDGPLGTIVYEMFGLEDSFGRVMRNNLQARSVSLPGTIPYPTFESLPKRFTAHGYTSSTALTLRDIRRTYIHPGELERTAKLEMLDEIEELELVLQHYAITWGVKTTAPRWNSEWALI